MSVCASGVRPVLRGKTFGLHAHMHDLYLAFDVHGFRAEQAVEEADEGLLLRVEKSEYPSARVGDVFALHALCVQPDERVGQLFGRGEVVALKAADAGKVGQRLLGLPGDLVRDIRQRRELFRRAVRGCAAGGGMGAELPGPCQYRVRLLAVARLRLDRVGDVFHGGLYQRVGDQPGRRRDECGEQKVPQRVKRREQRVQREHERGDIDRQRAPAADLMHGGPSLSYIEQKYFMPRGAKRQAVLAQKSPSVV